MTPAAEPAVRLGILRTDVDVTERHQIKRQPDQRGVWYVIEGANLDLARIPHGNPSEHKQQWKFGWIKARVARPMPVERSKPNSVPIGWEDGPLREKLETLSRLREVVERNPGLGITGFMALTGCKDERLANALVNRVEHGSRPSRI